MEAKFQNAHLAFLNVLEIASDDNTTGPEKDAVVAAVKELGETERLNSFCEDKESVRADGSVDKLMHRRALAAVGGCALGPDMTPGANFDASAPATKEVRARR